MGRFSDLSETKIKIPVRITKDGIRALDGKPLPEIIDDTIGDLVVPSYTVVDDAVRRQFLNEYAISVLPKESTILLGVPLNIPQDLWTKTFKPKNMFPPANYRFVQVHLKEDLILRLRGTKTAAFDRCECTIPALEKNAISLNHAFSLISEVFEANRKSHSGNVFKRGYYLDDEHWRSLDALRSSEQAKFERQTEEPDT
jgi:hypothetical protein